MINRISGWTLAIDVGGTKAALARIDDVGAVAAEETIAMRSPTGYVTQPGELATHISRFIASATSPPDAVGLSVAAAIGEHGDRLNFAPNLPGWQGTKIAALVEEVATDHVVAVYDGHAALWGERWKGAARDLTDVALITIGTGVGGGMIAGGRMVKGADGLAGVAGFLPVPHAGGVAPLEARIAGPALARRASEVSGRPMTTTRLFQAAEEGEPWAVQLLLDVEEDLSLGLSAITSLFNPQAIVLAGGVGLVLANRAEKLTQRVRQLAQPTAGARVRIVAASLGLRAPLFGAAWLARTLPSVRSNSQESKGADRGAAD